MARASEASGASRWKVRAAFAAIYVIWGSAYLGIRIAVRESPPLFAAGIRFLIAGAILYLWSRGRGTPNPRANQWGNLCLLGGLIFVPTYSALFWAEKTIPSGVAAILSATLPVWTVMMESLVFKTVRFAWIVLAPVMLGLAGVALLTIGKGGAGNLNGLACAAILASEGSWALGSVWSKQLDLPSSDFINSGVQMMSGGGLLLLGSLIAGELHPLPHVSTVAWLAIGYLVAVAVVGYTAYVWLLQRMPVTQVASYAYVTPVVALIIGYFVGGESVGWRQLAGAVLVIASVVSILRLRPATT